MLFPRARAPALALLTVAVVTACGDGESVPDGGAPDGAPGPDAEDLCPGQISFEALVADARSGEPTFEVTVAEAGGSASTTSAPNGRADLCLQSGDSTLRSSKADYLDRLDTLSNEALAIAVAAVQPYPLDVLGQDAADSLLDILGPGRDPAATLLLVSVVSFPDGAPLVGARVSLEDGVDPDGVFARDATGEFVQVALGDEAVADGRILMFSNVPLNGGEEDGRVALTVTPPAAFSGTCVGPPSVELQADGLSGAFFACQ